MSSSLYVRIVYVFYLGEARVKTHIVGNKGTKVHFYIREKMARWELGKGGQTVPLFQKYVMYNSRFCIALL